MCRSMHKPTETHLEMGQIARANCGESVGFLRARCRVMHTPTLFRIGETLQKPYRNPTETLHFFTLSQL